MHRLFSALALSALSLPSSLPLSAQDAVADGFVGVPLAVSPPILPSGPFGVPVFGLVRTLGTGEAITFDGLTVRRVSADGASATVLGTLPQAAFPGCFAIDPTETVALVGESSNGVLYRVDLAGGGMTPIATVPFNYDAVYEAPGVALLSAAAGLAGNNDILRLDVATGIVTPLCGVAGFAGPIALAPGKNLLYGHTDGRILGWTAAQLASGILLTEADAIPLADGFHGPTALAVDPVNGGIYLSDSDFALGTCVIVEVHTSLALSTVLVESTTPFASLSGLEVVGSPCGGAFAGWQPACGGTLRYSAADFVASTHRVAVHPARPAGSLTGPGAGPGPGAVAFEITGGPPQGFARVFFGPTAAFTTPESPYAFPGAQPLFTGFPLATIQVIPGFLLLDGAGHASLGTYDPGLDGLVTVQAFCATSAGVIVGTTSAAHL